MSDEDYKDMVISHDKHIDSLATSIESLASGVGATNQKLEDIISVISTQNVLIEKFTNLELNLKESFERIHSKIKAVEYKQEIGGCSVLNIESEKIKVINKRILNLEKENDKGIRPVTLKGLLIFCIVSIISFAGTVSAVGYQIDKTLQKKITIRREKDKVLDIRLDVMENHINRNYGRLLEKGK